MWPLQVKIIVFRLHTAVRNLAEAARNTVNGLVEAIYLVDTEATRIASTVQGTEGFNEILRSQCEKADPRYPTRR